MQTQNPTTIHSAPPAPVVDVGAVLAQVQQELADAGVQTPGSPAAMLRAQRAARSELRDQRARLMGERRDLARELSRTSTPVAAKGLESQIAGIDQRVAGIDQQLATLDAQIARTTQIPGAVVDPPRPVIVHNSDGMAWAALTMTFAAFVMIWAGWMRRQRGKLAGAASISLPREVSDRLARLEQAVDTVAVEVERISEGQRFLTRVFTENGHVRALGEGPAQPVAAAPREAVPIPKPS